MPVTYPYRYLQTQMINAVDNIAKPCMFSWLDCSSQALYLDSNSFNNILPVSWGKGCQHLRYSQILLACRTYPFTIRMINRGKNLSRSLEYTAKLSGNICEICVCFFNINVAYFMRITLRHEIFGIYNSASVQIAVTEQQWDWGHISLSLVRSGLLACTGAIILAGQ